MKNISIISDKTIGKNDRFWQAAGLDELFSLSLTESGDYLLNRMKEKGTCKYVRYHFTLSSCYRYGLRCGGEVYSEDEKGNPQYHFEWINSCFKKFVDNGIKPIVEMDFVPDALILKGDIIQEGTGEKQPERYIPNNWNKWHDLLVAFTKNLQDTFGVEETRSWYFEVWNEPDSWPVSTWKHFYKLYDVFVDAVTSVDDKLRVGGPGCFKNNFMHPFLDHITNGTNYVTGKRGTRCDFISYHIYGMSGGWLNEWPVIMPTVQRFTQELMWLQRTIEAYPSLKNTEVHLNEWGVVSNYERTSKDYPILDIRNSEYSALFMLKLIDCIFTLRRKYGLNLTLMLYWGFCGEDHFSEIFNGNRSITTAHHILKPIGTLYEMLNLLGDDLIEVKGIEPGSDCGCLASKSGNKLCAAVYKYNEYDIENEGASETFNITFENLENGRYEISLYTMDNEENNSFRLWEKLGRKNELSKNEAELIRNKGDFKLSDSFEADAESQSLTLNLEIKAQSLTFIKLNRI